MLNSHFYLPLSLFHCISIVVQFLRTQTQQINCNFCRTVDYIEELAWVLNYDIIFSFWCSNFDLNNTPTDQPEDKSVQPLSIINFLQIVLCAKEPHTITFTISHKHYSTRFNYFYCAFFIVVQLHFHSQPEFCKLATHHCSKTHFQWR